MQHAIFETRALVLAALLLVALSGGATAQNGFNRNGCPDFPTFAPAGAAVSTSTLSFNASALVGTCTTDAGRDLLMRWDSGLYAEPLCYPNNWGPQPLVFGRASINNACVGGWVSWTQQRLLQFISFVVSQGFDYCHHHLPTWTPPVPNNFLPCCQGTQTKNCSCPNPNNGLDLTCSICGCSLGLASTRGLDCTSYTSMLYNVAFGILLNADTADQACSPTAAPGVIVVANDGSAVPAVAQPGDILYIYQQGGAIGHAIVWTGYPVDLTNTTQFGLQQLIGNTDANDLQDTINDIRSMLAAEETVYVISDSHHVGPNYRPYAGWYRKSFSHMRRIINAGAVASPVPPASVYMFNNGDCYNHQGASA